MKSLDKKGPVTTEEILKEATKVIEFYEDMIDSQNEVIEKLRKGNADLWAALLKEFHPDIGNHIH